jgi:hypothetical protein
MTDAQSEAAKSVNHAQVLQFLADLNDIYFSTCTLRPFLIGIAQHELKSKSVNYNFGAHLLLIAQR